MKPIIFKFYMLLLAFAFSNCSKKNEQNQNKLEQNSKLLLDENINMDSISLINIISNNKLDKLEGKNLINTFKKVKEEKNFLSKNPLKSNFSTNKISSSSSLQECNLQYLNWSENTGAHWYVKSNTGYNQATGFITLPTVSVHSTNDRPYMYFGAYTTTGSLSSDAGLVYLKEDEKWHAFINVLIWDTSISAYKQVWKYGAAIDITNPYISYKVSSPGSQYDYFELIVINPANWSTITSCTVDSREVVSNSKPVNGNFDILTLTRETTLAQNVQNLNNGSYILNAKWDSVYIYNNSNYSLWQCANTAEAGKANNSSHWSKISVNSYTSWYSDDISISYY
ncbi:MAG: hypothetical protein WC623_15800 [Pedobacter sp.]|uniref:hypothetical protein n=1 Tax=Pedobacter sp. TaxID=1411316 RepID=UPI003561CC36